MNFRIIIVLILAIACQIIADDFILPSFDRRYDQVCYLSSHNSYAAESYGYVYANQRYSIDDQLQKGVRAFALDIYNYCGRAWFFGKETCYLAMCHGGCEINKLIQPTTAFTGPNKLVDAALFWMLRFLVKHPTEIITIYLENHAYDYKQLDQTFEDTEYEGQRLSSLVLKPTDWNLITQRQWPTLEWMITNNKRLVVFNTNSPSRQGYASPLYFASSQYTFYQWPVCAENQYAELDFSKAAQQRSESKDPARVPAARTLLLINYFPESGKVIGRPIGMGFNGFFGDFGVVNGSQLIQFLDYLLLNGLDNKYKNRYPNALQVNYFNEGNPLALVNSINAKANDPIEREAMFAPLPRPS